MTDQLPQHFCGLGITQARKDDLASVVIEDGVGFLDPVSRPELAEILHDRHEQHPAPRALRRETREIVYRDDVGQLIEKETEALGLPDGAAALSASA